MNPLKSVPLLAAIVAAMLTLASHLPAGQAHEVKFGTLTIDRPWVRPSIGQAPNSAAYMTLRNAGPAGDALLSVTTPVAERTEIHRSVMENGVMRMDAVDDIAVPAGGEAELQPGGLHVMLIGLKRRIAAGEQVPLTLHFRLAGSVTVEAVAAMRGNEAGDAAPGGHRHGTGH